MQLDMNDGEPPFPSVAKPQHNSNQREHYQLPNQEIQSSELIEIEPNTAISCNLDVLKEKNTQNKINDNNDIQDTDEDKTSPNEKAEKPKEPKSNVDFSSGEEEEDFEKYYPLDSLENPYVGHMLCFFFYKGKPMIVLGPDWPMYLL